LRQWRRKSRMKFASKKLLYVTMETVSEERPADGVEFIAIRAALSLAQRTQIQAAIVEIDGDSKAKATMDRYLMAFNEMAIADWYLVDEDTGKPAPYSKERIGDLDPQQPLVDKALKEFAARNPTR